MLFNGKGFSDDDSYLFVGFDFDSIVYYNLEREGHRFVFDGQLILTDCNGNDLEKRFFAFYFTFPSNCNREECDIRITEFFSNPGFEKFENPIKHFLNDNLAEISNPFLKVIERRRDDVKKVLSFLNGNNENFLSSSFKKFKNIFLDGSNFSDDFSQIKDCISCSFLLEEDVYFKATYDFESEFFKNSCIEFKLDNEDKAINFKNIISLPFDNLPQIIKFQSLFVDFIDME